MKKKNKTINQIGWAIFSDNKEELIRKPWKIFNDIRIYFIRLKYLKKYGCSETAFWETRSWFCEVMKEILTHYRYERNGTPLILQDTELDNENINMSNEENEKLYNEYLDKMLILLDQMTDSYYWDNETKQWDDDQYKKQEEAKNEFMKMFSKIFYALWE